MDIWKKKKRMPECSTYTQFKYLGRRKTSTTWKEFFFNFSTRMNDSLLQNLMHETYISESNDDVTQTVQHTNQGR